MSLFLRIFTVLLLSLSPTAAITQTTKPAYSLDLRFAVDGVLLGEPKMSVAAGQPALVTVDKEGGYSLRVTATPLGADRVQVDAVAYRRVNGDWVLTATPSMQMSLGSRASVQSATNRAASTPFFRFEALVTSSKVAGTSAISPVR